MEVFRLYILQITSIFTFFSRHQARHKRNRKTSKEIGFSELLEHFKKVQALHGNAVRENRAGNLVETSIKILDLGESDGEADDEEDGYNPENVVCNKQREELANS